MNKKFLSAILFGALMIGSTGTFTSCKDYDDDISNLQGQIDANKSAITELQSQINSGEWVAGVTSTADGIIVKLGNGKEYSITNGKDGANGSNGADGQNGISPKITVADGYIKVSYDNGTTYTNLIALSELKGEQGGQGEKGEDGITPTFSVGSDGHLYVQYGDDTTTKKDLGISISGIWKIQCKLPPKTKRFYPLKTFNNAPLKSLDRWGYYYFSLFPSVCSHFTDTFSCQLNPVRRMYNTIHNGICYCRVSDCIIPIVRWQLRGDDDGLAPMSVLYYIEQDGAFLGIKVHKEEVIQYEQRAPFDSLEFRFQCAFYFCHLKRTHKFRSIRIICPYALLAGFIPHCCGKEALPGTG